MEDATFELQVTQTIDKSETIEGLLSRTIKCIILGKIARSSYLYDDGLFILVVNKVKTRDSVDVYERLGSGRLKFPGLADHLMFPRLTDHLMFSRLTEVATLQIIFLA